MKVQFLWFAGCPSHDVALKRLRLVLEQEGLQPDIEIIEVKTDDEAEHFAFVGSPTIRIDGVDIVPIEHVGPYRLTCRTYVTEDGRFSPLPSEASMRRAVQSAKQRKEQQA
jgi:hypothetical protein